MSDAGESATAPALLKGKSYFILSRRGALIQMLAALGIPPIAFESDMGSYEWLYALGFGAFAFVVSWVGCAVGLVAWRKRGREIEHGYTSSIKVAREDMDLFWVHPITLQVIRRPGEPRP